jgi:D-arginine dehydrogenase
MKSVDVLIVGGGIAGASAGYFLAATQRVLLVEREAGYGYHTSGRSAAEWTACHFDGLMRGVVLYGRPFLDAPPAGFASVPLLERRGNLMFAREGGEAQAEAFYAHAHPDNPGLERLEPARIRALAPHLRIETVAQAFWDPENCEIDVDALHQGFLRGLRAAGGETRGDAEFHGAERVPGGWRARVGADTVHARVIVNAAGAWGDPVATACGVAPLGLQPRRRTAFTFDPGFDASGGPVIDEMVSGFYVKSSGPILMVSPGDQTPSIPCDAQPDEYDLAVAVDHLETLTTLRVGRMKAKWAGLRTFVADEQPVAGFDLATPDFFWLVGQGGGGIMSASGLGDLTARLIGGLPWPESATALGVTAEWLSPARLTGHSPRQ